MTPQLSQVFGMPSFGVIAVSAVQADAVAGHGVTNSGQDCDFAALVQNDAAESGLQSPNLATTVPPSADIGTQTAAAVALIGVFAVVPSIQNPEAKETVAAFLDQKDDILDEPDEIAVELPETTISVQAEVCKDAATAKPPLIVEPAARTVSPDPNPPRSTDGSAGKVSLRATVDQQLPKHISATPKPADQEGPGEESAEVFPLSPSLRMPVTSSVFTASAPNGAPIVVAPSAPPELPLAKVEPVPVSADADATTGLNPVDLSIETAPIATRFAPAETVFRLRTGTSDPLKLQADAAPNNAASDVGSTDTVVLPAHLVVPKLAQAAVANSEQIFESKPFPDLPALTDEAWTLPALFGSESVQPSFVDSSLAKMILPTSAQITPLMSAVATVPDVFLPKLTTDLVAIAKTGPNGPVEILLNPEELGHLRFEIHQKADHVRVVLSAERPEIIEYLRRNADHLLGEFKQAGFSGATLSFGQWDQQGSNPRPPPAPQPPPQEWLFDPPSLPKAVQSTLEMAASTGLNIRL